MRAARSDGTTRIIPYVDRHFRTRASREGRALAGLSMGGFVVMHTGLSRLDTFSELYVYSSGHFPDGLPKFEEPDCVWGEWSLTPIIKACAVCGVVRRKKISPRAGLIE